jgi:hypothetical protein
MYPTKYPIARKYETFPSLLLVHTVVLCPSSLQTWDLNTGDRIRAPPSPLYAVSVFGRGHCELSNLPVLSRLVAESLVCEP